MRLAWPQPRKLTAGLFLFLALAGASADPPAFNTIIVTADFQPGYASTGYFQYSVDMTNWTTLYTFPYPVTGATVSATNYTSSPIGFYRAGYSL